jgi:hypothetical protein
MPPAASIAGTVFPFLMAALAVQGCASPVEGGRDGGAAGCGSLDAGEEIISGEGISLCVRSHTIPGIAVIAGLEVMATGFESVRAEYGETEGYGFKTPEQSAGRTWSGSIVLAGIAPAAKTHYRLVAVDALGASRVSADRVIAADRLPEDLPIVRIFKDSGAGDFILFGAVRGLNDNIYAMVVDRHGRLYWYKALGTGISNAFKVMRHPDGNFLLYDTERQVFDEVGIEGDIRHTWAIPGGRANGHDILPLTGGGALMLGYGGSGDAVCDTIDGVGPDGAIGFHWQSPPFPAVDDPYHPNSLELASDGNYIVSLRNRNTVVKLDKSTGAELWRLGGEGGDFAIFGDPAGGPSKQHSARLLENGDILIFDNGNDRHPAYSRAVQYRLDEKAMTATMVWERRHDPDLFSYAGGSVQRLPYGNTLMAWAGLGMIDEAALDGSTTWELRLVTGLIYNAVWLDSFYPAAAQ